MGAGGDHVQLDIAGLLRRPGFRFPDATEPLLTSLTLEHGVVGHAVGGYDRKPAFRAMCDSVRHDPRPRSDGASPGAITYLFSDRAGDLFR
jgi:hypothetical protein